MATKCVIGIDGGGTKTHLICMTLDQEVICEVFGLSSNLCSNTTKQVEDNLIALIKTCKDKIGEPIDIVSVCLGTAGLSYKGAKQILGGILKKATNCNQVSILGDMVIPMIAEIEDKPGAILIAGTGAISYGHKSPTQTYRSSGWGHIVGDEGSAYWIANQGIRAALKSYDNRGKYTVLYDLFMAHLGCSNIPDLISTIHSENYGKQDMAKLSMIVDQAAKKGDKIAEEILKQAAEELFDTVNATIKSLKLSDEKEFHVVLCGSVLVKNDYINGIVQQLIKEEYDNSIILNASKPPVWGSVMYAVRSVKNG